MSSVTLKTCDVETALKAAFNDCAERWRAMLAKTPTTIKKWRWRKFRCVETSLMGYERNELVPAFNCSWDVWRYETDKRDVDAAWNALAPAFKVAETINVSTDHLAAFSKFFPQ